MYVYEKFAARPTLDIDFLGNNISNEGTVIASAMKEICSVRSGKDGVSFDTERITFQNITEFKDYHGIRLSIPVHMDTITQVLTMDIGFGDIVTPAPVDIDYPLLLEDLDKVNILAYSLETVIAEKMHAVVDLADQSSRMKDYYDLYKILKSETYNLDTLQEAVECTFRNRHTPYSPNNTFFRKEFCANEQMQAQWAAFMRKIASKEVLSFEQVVTYLQKELQPLWEKLAD